VATQAQVTDRDVISGQRIRPILTLGGGYGIRSRMSCPNAFDARTSVRKSKPALTNSFVFVGEGVEKLTTNHVQPSW